MSILQELLEWARRFAPEAYIKGGTVIVPGNFDCSCNQLTSLPDSIGEMRVGGGFYCSNNQLTSLPDSIGKMRVGGDFLCYYNQLVSYAKPSKLNIGIHPDESYTYLDGILTDIISVKKIDGNTVVKHSFGFVVSNGEHHAHGADLRQENASSKSFTKFTVSSPALADKA